LVFCFEGLTGAKLTIINYHTITKVYKGLFSIFFQVIKITVMEYIRDKLKDSKAIQTAVGTGALLVALSGQPAEAQDQDVEPVQEEVVEESYMEEAGIDIDINLNRVSTNVDLDTSGFMHRYADSFEDEPLDIDYSEDEADLGVSGILSIEVYDTEEVVGEIYGKIGPNKGFTSKSSRNINDIDMGFPEKMDAYVHQEADISVGNMALGGRFSFKPEDSRLHKLSADVGVNRKSASFNEEMNIRFYDSELKADEYTRLRGSGIGFIAGANIKYAILEGIGANDEGSIYMNLGAAYSNANIDMSGNVRREIDSYGNVRELDEDYDTEMDVSEFELRFGIGGSF